ncbi:hypothetical protein QO034_06510 [Sedimentitalea sp. JM2-8]|uniref:DUF2158 domain-containing protein n=1 Tax=Sedimentitalea xiamensis TaxID=3050037 RepID=A0ABT7FCA7_9RHOB|nr:hypothetical protein [Sedimentitalea xiamensis]MDK3072756.1 hypothetical protein [Sedimentitalea xiamensis]
MRDDYQLRSKFLPGDSVIVGGDIRGQVERVIFPYGLVRPLILVEWWDSGSVQCREFHEDQLMLAPDARET